MEVGEDRCSVTARTPNGNLFQAYPSPLPRMVIPRPCPLRNGTSPLHPTVPSGVTVLEWTETPLAAPPSWLTDTSSVIRRHHPCCLSDDSFVNWLIFQCSHGHGGVEGGIFRHMAHISASPLPLHLFLLRAHPFSCANPGAIVSADACGLDGEASNNPRGRVSLPI